MQGKLQDCKKLSPTPLFSSLFFSPNFFFLILLYFILYLFPLLYICFYKWPFKPAIPAIFYLCWRPAKLIKIHWNFPICASAPRADKYFSLFFVFHIFSRNLLIFIFSLFPFSSASQPFISFLLGYL